MDFCNKEYGMEFKLPTTIEFLRFIIKIRLTLHWTNPIFTTSIRCFQQTLKEYYELPNSD